MAKLRIVTDNFSDNALTSVFDTNSTETIDPNIDAVLGIENIKNVSRSKIARHNGVTDWNIESAPAQQEVMNAIIIGRHNFSTDVDYRITLYDENIYTYTMPTLTTIVIPGDHTPHLAGSIVTLKDNLNTVLNASHITTADAVFGGVDTTFTIASVGVNSAEGDAFIPAYDSGILTVLAEESGSDIWKWGDFAWGAVPWGGDRTAVEFSPTANLVHWLPVDISTSWSKILFSGTPANITAFDIGRLILGKYIQPTYNLSLGHSLTWVEKTKQFRTEAGTLRSDITIPNRRFEFNTGTLTEEDRDLVQGSLRTVGMRRDMFLSMFPEDLEATRKIDYSGIVKLVKIPKFTEFANRYYKSNYVMEEV